MSTQIQIASGGSNIYNADGSLTAARTLTLSGNPLTIAGTTSSRFFTNGNVGVGTTTDAGYKADINGTTRISNVLTTVGTTSSDTSILSAELATTASGTNWTGTSLPTGYSHLIGSASPLVGVTNAIIGVTYVIEYYYGLDEDTGTGSIASFTFGGQSIPLINLNSYVTTAVVATTTALMSITPTSDFNGYFAVSLKRVTASTASIINKRSDGTTVNEYRATQVSSNLFFGINAGSFNYLGSVNTFIGSNAGQSNVVGYDNTFIGNSAGNKNIIGYMNTFVGSSAGYSNTSGAANTFIGYQSGIVNTTGINNVFIGQFAGFSNTQGNNNTFIGTLSGRQNTTGSSNVFNGYYAGYANTSGNFNTSIGEGAGFSNATGLNNTAIGRRSHSENSSGSDNTIIGYFAGYNSYSSENTFIGSQAGQFNGNSTGTTCIGFKAGFQGGGNNTKVGWLAGTLTTVSGMVAIGAGAARFFGNLNNTNTGGGGNGIYIGNQVNVGTNSSTNEIVIGAIETGLGTGTTLIGNGSTTLTALRGNVVIGTTVNNAAAGLQVDSTTRGFLPPRMTTTQKNAITSPPAGLVVYDTDLNKLCVRGASAWQTITSA